MMRCRRPLIVSSVVAVAAFALLAAGCGGGGGSPRVASVASSTTVATTTTQNAQNGLVAFARCMRTHGVPNFPDPRRVAGRTLKLTVQQDAASNPRFPAAQAACQHLLPNGGNESQEPSQPSRALLADMLSFARCMRSHGLSRFPDPTAQGLSVEMVQAQGIDVHSPAVLRVVQTCLPASHGALTPSKVREALTNGGR